MRKLLAILLLSIHLFTIGGYRFVLGYFEQKADVSLVQRLDNNQYSEAELVTIKIPLNMPYMVSKSGFERYNGTININGSCYNYVQRKLVNDTLVLQCIPNNEKSKLSAAKREYAKNNSDTQPSSSGEKATGSLLKLFFSDYNYKPGHNLSASVAEIHSKYAVENDGNISSPYLASPVKPPRTV